jgi:hypothetical protein
MGVAGGFSFPKGAPSPEGVGVRSLTSGFDHAASGSYGTSLVTLRLD